MKVRSNRNSNNNNNNNNNPLKNNLRTEFKAFCNHCMQNIINALKQGHRNVRIVMDPMITKIMVLRFNEFKREFNHVTPLLIFDIKINGSVLNISWRPKSRA